MANNKTEMIKATEEQYNKTKWLEFEFEGAKITLFKKDTDSDESLISIERNHTDVLVGLNKHPEGDNVHIAMHGKVKNLSVIKNKETKAEIENWGE
jgi:hypothetical protein